jgi:hypothetical protein
LAQPNIDHLVEPGRIKIASGSWIVETDERKAGLIGSAVHPGVETTLDHERLEPDGLKRGRHPAASSAPDQSSSS